MNPRDQATAIRLLIQWRALFDRMSGNNPLPSDGTSLRIIGERITRLVDETDLFIAGETGDDASGLTS